MGSCKNLFTEILTSARSHFVSFGSPEVIMIKANSDQKGRKLTIVFKEIIGKSW